MKRNARRFLSLLAITVAAPVPALASDASDPEGQWHLVSGSLRLEASIQSDGMGGWSGSLDIDGKVNAIDEIEWQPVMRTLQFRHIGDGMWSWYRGRIVEGILAGRATPPSPDDSLPPVGSFTRHVTGWNSSHLDDDIVPRVFDAVLGDGFLARIRIDRATVSPTAYVGQMKIYATVGQNAAGEDLQYDLDVTLWDGTQLEFARQGSDFWQSFQGTVEGRHVTGTFSQSGTPQIFPWFGERAEVLSHGLSRRSKGNLAAWQERTRRQLALLKMAGAPQPLQTTVNVLQDELPPRPSTAMFPRRDDDPASWPQNYTLSELEFLHTLDSPYGAGTLVRRGHGYLAAPKDDLGRRPAVLALNGHTGSAWRMMDPDDPDYWYGDSFARRGHVVLALDVSHRAFGDDPDGGNGPHPPIAAPGFDSDWEEDGERVWTAMRAVDYLLGRPDVDPSRLIVVGLSMGGEVATLLAAMDTRISLVVSSGYSPDFNVIAWNDNHPCWQWQHADIREYVEIADYQALIAPRPLIVQNGRFDSIFSLYEPPFASAKQVVRRGLPLHSAHGAAFVHHLHDRAHAFRVGDTAVDGEPPSGIAVPTIREPGAPWDLSWQVDPQTHNAGHDLYALIDALIDTLFANGFESATAP